MLRYTFAGLVLASEIPLAGLAPLAGAAEAAMSIRLGDVPDRIADAARVGPNWALGPSRLLLKIPGLASFLLADGREIRVQLAADRAPEEAGAFLTQDLLGLLLQQGGRVVLRAGTVALGGQAILLCGDAAAGKSSFAAAMMERGHRFLGDDLCTIESCPAGAILVRGDGAGPRLWADAIDALDLRNAPREAIRTGFEKYSLQPPVPAADGLPLAGLYSLYEDRRIETPQIEAVRGLGAVQAVREAAYRLQALGTAEQKLRFFQAAADIARRTSVFSLIRAKGFNGFDEALQAIEMSSAATGESRSL